MRCSFAKRKKTLDLSSSVSLSRTSSQGAVPDTEHPCSYCCLGWCPYLLRMQTLERLSLKRMSDTSSCQGCGVGVVGSRRFLDGVGVGVGILRVLGVGVGIFDPTPTPKVQLN